MSATNLPGEWTLQASANGAERAAPAGVMCGRGHQDRPHEPVAREAAPASVVDDLVELRRLAGEWVR